MTSQEWHTVAEVYEIPEGTVHAVTFENTPIAIFRVDGQFYAIEDRCTHADVALSDGYVEGHIVYCPLHGANFDVISGQALCPPAYEPVRTFALRLVDEFVQIARTSPTTEETSQS
jgi:3-phenylpropionate/trans-cinnamate dioxygenase ferredoxin subunit